MPLVLPGASQWSLRRTSPSRATPSRLARGKNRSPVRPCPLPGRPPCPSPPFLDPPGCARHRPEATLLYQLVERHYPEFHKLRAEVGRPLPEYVQEEFEACLKCGRLEEDFLRVRCE